MINMLFTVTDKGKMEGEGEGKGVKLAPIKLMFRAGTREEWVITSR